MSSTSATAAKAAQRLELNLKNLRRHDPAIKAIVGQAAYVGAYWNDGTGWVRRRHARSMRRVDHLADVGGEYHITR